MNQLSIDFGDGNKRRARPVHTLPGARKRDPATSHAAAAAAGRLSQDHQAMILRVLKDYGPMGKDRIAALAGLTGVQVCRRLPELREAGLIEPTGKTVPSSAGRAEREFRSVERAP